MNSNRLWELADEVSEALKGEGRHPAWAALDDLYSRLVEAAREEQQREAKQREEAGQREGQIEAGRCCMHARCPGGSLCCCTEAGPDPLDEDDHRDRLDAGGTRWTRAADGCWANGAHHVLELISLPGPLTFAPDTTQEGR